MLGLVSKGIPWEVVMSADHVTREGFLIALGRAEGFDFDWEKMEWLKPKV
jgi:hypothetical protein